MKVWLVTLTDENVLASNRQHVVFVSLSQWRNYAHGVNWNGCEYKSWWNSQYRNDAHPVMARFSEMALLTSFYVYNSMCITKSKCSCACLVWRRVTAFYGHDVCNISILTTTWLWLSYRAITVKWIWFTCFTGSRRLGCQISAMHVTTISDVSL